MNNNNDWLDQPRRRRSQPRPPWHTVVTAGVAVGAVLVVVGFILFFSGGLGNRRADIDAATTAIDGLFASDGTLSAGVSAADLGRCTETLDRIPAQDLAPTDLPEKLAAAQAMFTTREGMNRILDDDEVLRDEVTEDDILSVQEALSTLSESDVTGAQVVFDQSEPRFLTAQTQFYEAKALDKSISELFIEDEPIAATTRATQKALAERVNAVPNPKLRADFTERLNQVADAITSREASEAATAKKLDDTRKADEKRIADELAAKKAAEEAQRKAEEEAAKKAAEEAAKKNNQTKPALPSPSPTTTPR